MPSLAQSHLKWARTSAFVFTVKADTGGDMHIWEGSTFQSGALCNTNNTRPSWERCFLVKTYCILKGGDCLGRWQEKVYWNKRVPPWQLGSKASHPRSTAKGWLLAGVHWPNTDTAVTASLLRGWPTSPSVKQWINIKVPKAPKAG